MSVTSVKHPPILRSFICSPLFEAGLLSGPIAQMAGDRETAVFFNSIDFHPDFQSLPELRIAHVTFAKDVSDRTMTDCKTAKQASLALKKAVDERNPILLEELGKLGSHRFDDSYNHLSALYDLAALGDFHGIKRMYRCCRIVNYAHRQVIQIVVNRGDLLITEWLLDNHPLPRNMGDILALAFKCPCWEKMVLLIVSKIPPSQMKQALFEGVASILKEGITWKLEFLLEHTKTRQYLTEEDWEKIFVHSTTRVMALFILDPNNQIPISNIGFYNLTKACRENEIWDVLESILSSDRAQRDLEFLKNIHCERLDRKFYEILDRKLHFFQSDCIFSVKGTTSWFVGNAVDWNCLNILRAFVESPGAIRDQFFNHWMGPRNSGYHQNYTILTSRLLQMAKIFENAGCLDLKKQVDREISRRNRFTTAISIWMQECFGATNEDEIRTILR